MSENTEQRFSPGDVRIEKAILFDSRSRYVDITGVVTNIELHEDLDAPFAYGTLYVADAGSLLEAAALTGEELLALRLVSPVFGDEPHGVHEHMYHVVRMTHGGYDALKNMIYQLHFVSVEFTRDVNERISRRFTGKPHAIIESIFRDYLDVDQESLFLDETSNDVTYVSNFWTPSQNARYLTLNAINARHRSPSYVFYQTNGKFVFASLRSLVEAPTYMQFFKHEKVRLAGENQDLSEEYSKILDVSYPVFFDYYERLRSGVYGTSIRRCDMMFKRLSFLSRFPKFQYEQNEPLLMGDEENAVSSFSMVEGIISASPEANAYLNLYVDRLFQTRQGDPEHARNNATKLPVEHHQRRMYSIAKLGTNRIIIRVFGRFDYAIGQVMGLTFYTNRSIDGQTPDDELIDKRLTGRWMVVKLMHDINAKIHYTIMELVKDSVIIQD